MAGHDANVADVVVCCKKVCWKGYRKFLELANSRVSHLLDSDGQDTTYQYVTVGEEHEKSESVTFRGVRTRIPSVPTELQKQLWMSIGFDDLGDDLMYLADFEGNKRVLQNFCKLAREELEISGGDPAAYDEAHCGSDDSPASVVAHFSYQFFMGIYMKVMHLRKDCLRSHLSDIRTSAEAVEKAACRLGIMSPSSEIRNVWDWYKSRVLLYVETMNNAMKVEINESYWILIGLFLSELTRCRSVSPRLVELWEYGQHIEYLLSLAHDGGDFNLINPEILLENCVKLGDDPFTEEYMQKLRHIRNYMKKVGHRPLTDDEMFDVHALLKWKSEHFLTCFRSQAFEDEWVLPLSRPVCGLERGPDLCDTSNDGVEKSDKPEKTVRLDSLEMCDKASCDDSCEKLDLSHIPNMPSDGLLATVKTHEVANFGDNKPRHSSTSSVASSHNYRYVGSISDRMLRWWLKETLAFVSTSGSNLTSLSFSVFEYLVDLEMISPRMCDALD